MRKRLTAMSTGNADERMLDRSAEQKSDDELDDLTAPSPPPPPARLLPARIRLAAADARVRKVTNETGAERGL